MPSPKSEYLALAKCFVSLVAVLVKFSNERSTTGSRNRRTSSLNGIHTDSDESWLEDDEAESKRKRKRRRKADFPASPISHQPALQKKVLSTG